MSYAKKIDWIAEGQNGNWENHGRSVAEQECNHSTEESDQVSLMQYQGYCEECRFSEDSCEPMMNFIYPLELENPDEEKIYQVVKRTACTVMENTETGEWGIALCGGGMDFSQDIALAYVLLEKWIPYDLLENVSIQKGLTVDGKDWKLLRNEAIEQADNYADRFQNIRKQWEETKQ